MRELKLNETKEVKGGNFANRRRGIAGSGSWMTDPRGPGMRGIASPADGEFNPGRGMVSGSESGRGMVSGSESRRGMG